jgi:hypothetical protein
MWAYHQFSGIEDELIERHLTPVEVRAGDAVILDDALVHYSPPNETDADRLAIQFVMVPREADSLFFQQVDADGDLLEVDVWRVEPPFFFNFWHGDGDPSHGTVVERVSVPAPLLQTTQFEALMGVSASVSRQEPDETAPGEPALGETPPGEATPTAARRSLLSRWFGSRN